MTRENIYLTNLILSAGVLVIGLYFKYDWPIYVSLGIMALTAISTAAAKIIATAWLKTGEFLGNINGKIILSIFFFMILLPVALIKRLVGKTSPTPETSTWKSLKDVPTDFTKLW